MYLISRQRNSPLQLPFKWSILLIEGITLLWIKILDVNTYLFDREALAIYKSKIEDRTRGNQRSRQHQGASQIENISSKTKTLNLTRTSWKYEKISSARLIPRKHPLHQTFKVMNRRSHQTTAHTTPREHRQHPNPTVPHTRPLATGHAAGQQRRGELGGARRRGTTRRRSVQPALGLGCGGNGGFVGVGTRRTHGNVHVSVAQSVYC